MKKEKLKAQILELTREYYKEVHDIKQNFIPGITKVNYGGRYFDAEEMVNLVDSSLDFWLTAGPWAHKFETRFAKWLGMKYCSLCNSGSSANLLAFSALTSQELGERAIKRGDEVITVAAGFPTTVSAILQYNAVPVFVDMNVEESNIDITQLEAAYSSKTKAVMIAHTLGNPFNIQAVVNFCKKYNIWLVEDNCDALGAEYLIDGEWKKTGTIGDIGTSSFYPPHHMTMGEGGAVYTNNSELDKYIKSFRDWGRDCWCASGKDNTCHKRFDWQLGELPRGYDHKYIYSHLGYNLKPLDPQAAIGRQQLKKLPAFIEARKQNWNYLRAGLADLAEYVDFTLPTHATGLTSSGFTWDTTGCQTDCSWFGFMLRVKPTAPFTHTDLGRHLDEKKIGNRMLFGGNLVRQPVFVQLKKDRPASFRLVGDLAGADAIMNSAIFLGTYPGLTKAMLAYEIDTIRTFVGGLGGRSVQI